MRPRPLHPRLLIPVLLASSALAASVHALPQRVRAAANGPVSIEGPLVKWHALTMSFRTAVDTHESLHPAGANPFLDFRLMVAFRHLDSGARHEVPGYYAGDGEAADTSAKAGAVWQVRFAPDRPGLWSWTASFRHGPGIAVDRAQGGASADPGVDGALGTFEVAAADPFAVGALADGRLEYVHGRYFRFAESGALYLKNGAGGPENFLAYYQFDGTSGDPASLCLVAPHNPERLHRYAPHAGHYVGDDIDRAHLWGSPPRGHNLLGAVNYLAGVGVNSLSLVTFGYLGDGNDVWPWVTAQDKRHFDLSRMAQWERALAHLSARGVRPQIVLEEDENDTVSVAAGGLGFGLTLERRLYYREMVARFAHHPALIWIIGEESNYYDQYATMEAMASELRALDPYDHPIAFHSKHPCAGPGCAQEYPTVLAQYEPYFGFDAFEASAFQTVPGAYNTSTLQLVSAQAAARPWAHFGDEQSLNAIPSNLAENRRKALWGNLMAGGAGIAWYPGNAVAAQYPPGVDLCDYYDVAIEDLQLLQDYFLQTAVAIRIFQERLPFAQMVAANHLASPHGPQDYVFQRAESGSTRAVYAVYRATGSATMLTLGSGMHTVEWFNPRTGAGPLAAPTLLGPGTPALSPPAQDPGQDWLAIVRQQ